MSRVHNDPGIFIEGTIMNTDNIHSNFSMAFRHTDGRSLTMIVGVEVGYNVPYCYRVKMYGTQIPFPVRSGTWFVSGMGIDGLCGFMLDNGYNLVSKTNLHTGTVVTYKTQSATESNVTESDAEYLARTVIMECAQILWAKEERIKATKLLYRAGGFNSLHEAMEYLKANA